MSKLIKKAGDKSVNTSVRFDERNQRWIAEYTETTEEYFLNENDARKWIQDIYNLNASDDLEPVVQTQSVVPESTNSVSLDELKSKATRVHRLVTKNEKTN